MNAKIVAIEYFFPENKLDNNDLSLEFAGHDFLNFEKKVGIKCRYIVSDSQTALDLAVEACKLLFLRIDKLDVDFILYCTQSPEYFLPTSACILQDRVGLRKNIGALDFNLGCSGYTYGISMAKGLIKSGAAKNVLLVTAETYSKFLHPKDRSNRSIFGDAASATLISATSENGIGEFVFGTDGSGYEKLIVRNGAGKNKFDQDAEQLPYGTENIYSENHLYMNGPEIMNFTTDVIPGFVQEILDKNNRTKEEISQFVFHQANSFMLNLLRKKIAIDKGRFYNDLEDGGNTVSNTIPIALKRYSEQNENIINQEILLVGFGVGLSWCGGIVTIYNKL